MAAKTPAKNSAKGKPRAKAPAKRKVGRPSGYSDQVVDTICNLMAHGISLRKVCLMEGMPAMQTVMGWLNDPARENFRTKYARAREAQADYYAAETVDIADEDTAITKRDGENVEIVFDAVAVARNRLRLDARKWYAAKLAPKKYGDRVEQVHSGAIGIGQVLAELDGASSGLPSAG